MAPPTNVSAPAFEILKIHSAFRNGRFLVWGEVDPRKSSPRRLPFCATPVRIRRAMSQVVDQADLPADFEASRIWLPTIGGKPVGPSEGKIENPSAATAPQIQPWIVSAAILSAESTFHFLDACNRNPFAEGRDTKLAPSTRFWGAALRFVAGLAVRDRFIPSASAEGESFHARWKPLIIAPDQDRLRSLARAMPPVARAVTPMDAKAPPEDDPAVLLSGFVAWLMDVLPRVASSSARLSVSLLRDVNKRNIDAAWMIRLRTIESEMPGSRELLSSFSERVNSWHRPVVQEAAFPWLLSFELHEPHEESDRSSHGDHAEAGAWRVKYQFEPVHGGPALPVDQAPPRFAARLLARAATICADVRENADYFPLDVTGAFRFLTETGGLLQQQGFRVVLPEWWTRRERSVDVRARPVIKPSTVDPPSVGSAGMFSLSELMRFDWEVAIGGENFTREELDWLSSSSAPLVKVHGKWLPFDPASIRAALELWKREPAPARDVIRMALGAANPPAGVQFEEARGEGWIGELLGKLGGHTRFEELPPPAGLKGTLRPYQVRGFSWLGFLRQ